MQAARPVAAARRAARPLCACLLSCPAPPPVRYASPILSCTGQAEPVPAPGAAPPAREQALLLHHRRVLANAPPARVPVGLAPTRLLACAAARRSAPGAPTPTLVRPHPLCPAGGLVFTSCSGEAGNGCTACKQARARHFGCLGLRRRRRRPELLPSRLLSSSSPLLNRPLPHPTVRQPGRRPRAAHRQGKLSLGAGTAVSLSCTPCFRSPQLARHSLTRRPLFAPLSPLPPADLLRDAAGDGRAGALWQAARGPAAQGCRRGALGQRRRAEPG